jgi:hypothetical protein
MDNSQYKEKYCAEFQKNERKLTEAARKAYAVKDDGENAL